MTGPLLPASARPALLELQSMLRQFWPDHDIPLEFWRIEDDEVFYDALQYLPCCMLTRGGSSGNGHSEDDIERLPPGFRLAVPIFELEDSFDNEGWGAIANLGEEGLRRVIASYREVGLAERADALDRVLGVYLNGAEDDEAFKRAAKGKLPDLRDDETSVDTVIAFLRETPEELFGTP
jgi:hypothetical protein